MRLGFTTGSTSKTVSVDMDMIREAEGLGYHVVRTSEAYGADAVTRAAWILAQTQTIRVGTGIMQFAARTPAMTAMTAISLDHLSDGRFDLGLGANSRSSGPNARHAIHQPHCGSGARNYQSKPGGGGVGAHSGRTS